MSTVTVTRLVHASASDVWRVLTELSARDERLTGVHSLEVLTDGPVTVGTIWRETRRQPDGSDFLEEFQVVEAVPPRRLMLASRGIGVDYRITYTLTPADSPHRQSETAVTVVQDAIPAVAWGRMLALLFGGLAARAVEGAIRNDLAELAAAAERLNADPAAA